MTGIREVSQALNADAERICRELLPAGHKEGNQWVIGNWEGEKGQSCRVELTGPHAGQWFDHASKEKGDLLGLIRLQCGGNFVEAANRARALTGVRGESGNGAISFDPLTKKWKDKKTGIWRTGDKAFTYLNKDREVVCYVVRFNSPPEKPGGKARKDILPLRKDDKGDYRWSGYKGDEKRPIFGEEFLGDNDGRPLLIVEGEGKAIVSRKRFPKLTVVSWMGGASNVLKGDWGKWKEWKGPIILWPDNDDEGRVAMIHLKARLGRGIIVQIPKTYPQKWDLGDPDPEGESPEGLLADVLDPKPQVDDKKPYVALGYDEKGYYFVNRIEGFLLCFTAPSLATSMNIYRIAPDVYWESQGLFKGKTASIDYDAVGKILINECREAGEFDMMALRGRGLHWDNGRVIVHLGDRLLVDGVETQIVDHKTEYLYVKRPAIRGIQFNDPLPLHEASRVLEVLKLCTWEEKRYAHMMAGGVVCMLICGILPWRSHLFMMGESSSGKTYILERIVYPLVRQLSAYILAAASSEAGVRQYLGIDSICCLLEEFDADTPGLNQQLHNMMLLFRQASSDTGGIAVKGTTDGGGRQFALRTMALMVGTSSTIQGKIDRSRITFLELKKAGEGNAENFSAIKTLVKQTIGDQKWASRFIARILLRAHEAVAAIEVFRDVAAEKLGDTRQGDQIGTLLGGSWVLEYEETPSREDALAYFDAVYEGREKDEADRTDSEECLTVLTSTRIELWDNGVRKLVPIGNLIETILDDGAHVDDRADARTALENHGIVQDAMRDFICIMHPHAGTTGIFKGTRYEGRWADHLKRTNGAHKLLCRSHGRRYPSIAIPNSVFLT